jgi:hypothetical protein
MRLYLDDLLFNHRAPPAAAKSGPVSGIHFNLRRL